MTESESLALVRDGYAAGAFTPDRAFARFENQDSGCLAFGVEFAGRRWFVKRYGPVIAPVAASLARAACLHTVVRHPVIVPLAGSLDGMEGPTLVYEWRDGEGLTRAKPDGTDHSTLERFRRLPLAEVLAAVGEVLDANATIAAAGWIAGDLYDGCFLYDFGRRRMQLIDLDEYRPGPYVLDTDRLFGSTRYMAPEEFRRGAVIDERTTVFNLGRTIRQLLTDPVGGWRGSTAQEAVCDHACAEHPADRHPSVAALRAAWITTLHT